MSHARVKEDKVVSKQLAALREQDIVLLKKQLEQVEMTHREAVARVLRVEQREEAVRGHETALNLRQVQLEERERAVGEREKAAVEQEVSLTATQAELLHRAHQLEETAAALQQRKAAVQHREKMVQQQAAHVEQLQALVSRSYQHSDHPTAPPLGHEESHVSCGKCKSMAHVGAGRAPVGADRHGASRCALHRRQPQAAKFKEFGNGGVRGVEVGAGREKELQAVARLLQSERDRYFEQLQAIERLADSFEALPNTPAPLLEALRCALYP